MVCAKCQAHPERRSGKYRARLSKARELAALGGVQGSTREQHRRGLRDFRKASEHWTAHPALPASGDDVAIYVTYCVTERVPTLDASTAASYVGAVGAWHAQVQQAWGEHLVNPVRTRVAKDGVLRAARNEYKKEGKEMRPLTLSEWTGMWERGFLDTPQGAHQRLALMLMTLLALRGGCNSAPESGV